jgi:protein-S-isoprenylcysteine O-methyltransferase Ste14
MGLAAAAYALPAKWVVLAFPERLAVDPPLRAWFWPVATALLAAGAGLYARSARMFHRSGSGGRLVTDGPFAAVRHPLYACWLWLAIPGLALLDRSWPMLGVPVAAWAAFAALIGGEERELQRRFGAEYEAYAARTPRILPAWRDGDGPKTRNGDKAGR